MWEMILHVLHHAFFDSLKTLPFLLLAYLFIEWLEHRASEKFAHGLRRAGKYGPVIGALIGCVPQCGFSVLSVKLYNARIITMGALIAVFLSTSDEALPILLSDIGHFGDIWKLLLCKVIVAVAAGTAVDFVLRKKEASLHFHEEHHEAHEHHEHHAHEEHQHSDVCHCHCEGSILRPVLQHTLSTFLFILAVSVVLGLVIEWIGEENLSRFLLADTVWQPILAGLFGFIPNCAASVVLTQLYVSGGISFGAALAGLCTGAGVGVAVLFRSNKLKNSLTICGILYAAGVLAGILCDLIW